jgi:hypothetical protein
MKAAPLIFAMLIVATTLPAGTIDVSSSQTILVNGGDTLSFELFTGSFGRAAQRLNLASDPEVLRFAFMTSPMEGEQEFSATLRSADHAISIALDDTLNFADGYYSSAGFQGAVSTLQGQFRLDSAESQDLLQSGPVWIDLTNLGGNLTLGLAPLTLDRDLYASLSGGPLSVGAGNGAVLLEQPVRLRSARFMAAVFAPQAFTATPEPGSAWTMVCGGGLLLGLSAAIRRISRSRK